MKNHPLRLWPILSVMVALITIAGNSLAVPIPMAQQSADTPLSPAYQARHHRMIEAESKARFHAKQTEFELKSTPEMALYDVTHYDIDLVLNPTTHILTGTVTTTATVVGDSLTAVDLDLYDNMTVSAATAAGQLTTWGHVFHVVTIDLDRTYYLGEEFVVSVTYAGNPVSDSFAWDSWSGQHWIWTLSEPFGARRWWACKNTNDDKPDAVDIRVTVPEGLYVATNGLLVSQVDNGDTHTFHWHEQYPIVPYLVSLAVYPFATFSNWYHYAPGDSMELQYYVLPDQLSNAQLGYPVTVDMMHAFAGAFGEYPFLAEKYGHAHFDWGGGMEHQTLTSLAYWSYSDWLIAHELAHQWWGDMITCASFHHIWLNEGFATWSEAYWREVSEGMAAYHEEMDAAAYFGSGTIFVENPSNFGSIFSYWTTYAKASWVVHMLRNVLGEETFFAALADYRDAFENGSATTEEFRDVCEATSGQDLDAFFQQWIYGEYYPQYEFAWYSVPQGNATLVNLQISQVQTNTGLFTMPIDVTIITDAGPGAYQFVAQNSQAVQYYSYTVQGNVQSLELDKDNWILKTVQEVPVDVPSGEVVTARLFPNHPNPFNPRTTIQFALQESGPVVLTVFDLSGRAVRTLAAAEYPAGVHSIVWDGQDAAGRTVAAGTYFYRLEHAGWSETRKMTVIK